MNINQNAIWIKKFKMAILTNDKKNIKILIEDFPNLDKETLNEKNEVLHYLQKAKDILSNANKQLSDSMIKIKLQQKLIGALKQGDSKFLNKYI